MEFLNQQLPEHAIVGRGSFPLGDGDEPRPDAAILAEPAAQYWTRSCEPSDILVMIELSDSDLEREIGMKVALYARFGIPDYVVVDLQEHMVLHHHTPIEGSYSRVDRYRASSSFRFASLPAVAVPSSIFLELTEL